MSIRLLSLPFSDLRSSQAGSAAVSFAILQERGLRELRMRAADDWKHIAEEEALREMIPARDAGDVCHVCGEIVTWTDHLPPLGAHSAVRCYKNVHYLTTSIEIDDIFPSVGL